MRVNSCSQVSRSSELAAADTIGADEIGVAEAADRVRAIFLAAAPQVAAGKAAEHRRPPGLGALALQGVENFFDAVGHGSAGKSPG